MKQHNVLIAISLLLALCGCNKTTLVDKADRIVAAYVTAGSESIPDPACLTHINYAFGHVAETFDSVCIANPDRLRQIVELKKIKPSLKITLSLGGWGSGRFSEMAADDSLRHAFVADCRRIVDQYGLDGIDLDWEYPTSSVAGISSSPDDTENFTKLVSELRQTLGEDKLLTVASPANARYFDFAAISDMIDLVNIMTYDMAKPPYHHSAFADSPMSNGESCIRAVKRHLKAGVPADKLVLGIPFYGHGRAPLPDYINYDKIVELQKVASQKWDNKAKMPYLADEAGEMICCYDDPKSIAIKSKWLLKRGLRGAMYWQYDGDDSQGTLRNAVYNSIMEQ